MPYLQGCGELAGHRGPFPTHPPPLPPPLFRLKKVLKCHIPDPSEFFSQLKSEHGGDFQVGVGTEGGQRCEWVVVAQESTDTSVFF